MKTENGMICNWVVHDSKCTIPYTTFIHIKRPSRALVEKNTMCNTGRRAISSEGEMLNTSPSLEIAHFLPLLHNVLLCIQINYCLH